MNFENENDRRRKTVPRPAEQSEETPKPKKQRGHTPEVGQALRAAYQRTVSEDIPPEMLDLLGKLG